ncbi:HIT family protein [Natronobiforma cellulositropha]|uniref:HIT family protein n=1 Tax=Natronobiforma cellulositropha TaxID=1679076 RepID=UPI0021D59251|nr:HIT domain-containing protein [Natronobiforma cellulositropha]
MEQVFAPWRIEWIRREPSADDDGCVFCRLPDEDDDRANRIVARSDHAFVLLNNAPYNPGHVMVIPYAHTGDYADLSREQLLDHARLKQQTLTALSSAFDPPGFNVGLNLGEGAGGSIRDHLHTHVVPRWEGDTNFMPVVSDTTVIVEALEETYDHLHDAFADLEGATVESDDRAVDLSSEP